MATVKHPSGVEFQRLLTVAIMNSLPANLKVVFAEDGMAMSADRRERLRMMGINVWRLKPDVVLAIAPDPVAPELSVPAQTAAVLCYSYQWLVNDNPAAALFAPYTAGESVEEELLAAMLKALAMPTQGGVSEQAAPLQTLDLPTLILGVDLAQQLLPNLVGSDADLLGENDYNGQQVWVSYSPAQLLQARPNKAHAWAQMQVLRNSLVAHE